MNSLRRPVLFVVAVLLTLTGIPVARAHTQSATPVVAPATISPTWATTGPFPVTKQRATGTHTLYFPTNLGVNGMRHPIILWGNGTFATPNVYDALLRHWASWGFIVAAANTTMSGSGQEMLAGATFLANENARPGSVFYQKVDTAHIGASGHSQGGGGALNAGADPRVVTTVPIQPGPGPVDGLHGPMFLLAGQFDFIVLPLYVLPRYKQATHIPAIYGVLGGASHLTPIGDGGGYRGATTAWFRFWLMGDERARGEFFGPSCGLCTDRGWSDVRRNALALAIPGP